MSIWNWTMECDDCGQAHAEWYDLGTTVLCRRCLDEYKSFSGRCEICGEEDADIYYKVGNQCICGECIEEFKRN